MIGTVPHGGVGLLADLSHCETPEDAAAGLCELAGQLGVTIGGRFSSAVSPMVAWPGCTPAEITSAWQRRVAAEPVPAGSTTVDIDGRPYVVPHAVKAFILRVADSERRMAAQAQRLTNTLHCLQAGLPEPPASGRWTPAIKEAVVQAVINQAVTVDRALELYDLSADELDGWIRSWKRDGQRGLQAGRVST